MPDRRKKAVSNAQEAKVSRTQLLLARRSVVEDSPLSYTGSTVLVVLRGTVRGTVRGTQNTCSY